MADASTLKNPFVGLRAFEEDEDYLFFGRGVEINDLIKKFSGNRFLAVIGSSGSGKSSLVKSGLLPAINKGFLSAGSNWRVAVIRPGDDPIGNLTKELSKEGLLHDETSDPKTAPIEQVIETTLRRNRGGLVQAFRQAHLPSTEKLLVVVDQFEELFRYSRIEKQNHEGRSDATGFVNLLLTAADQQDYPVYVLITMRSDFLGDCAEFTDLPEAINKGQYLVPRMTRDEMREAITRPVAVGGAQITPRLITRLLNDVDNNIDQLPIFQHAMMRTWDKWKKNTPPTVAIDLPDYEEIGSMKKALDKHAEEAYKELDKDQKKTCELMFKALTDKAADVRGIRRPQKVEDLCVLTGASEEKIIALVEVFRKAGRTFLMPPPGKPLDKFSVIDISHESVMRVWQRLIKWTDEEVQSAEIYKRISDAAKFYERGEADLWHNPELGIGLKWYKTNHPAALWAARYDQHFDKAIAFLKKSEETAIALQKKIDEEALARQKEKERKEKERRMRAIRWLIIFAVLAFLAFVGAGWMYGLYRTIASKNTLIDKQSKSLINKNDSLKISEKHTDSLRIVADTNTARAVKLQQKDSALAVKNLQLYVDANNAKLRAVNAHDSIVKVNDTIQIKNRRIAAAEYQRRIREGPTDEKRMIDSGWNYKYVAYCHHLDILKDSMHVQSAVKKNNELYDKLYYSFIFGKSDKDYPLEKLKAENPTSTGITDETFQLKNGGQVSLNKDKHALICNDDKIFYSSQSRISAVVFTNDSHALIATEDNVLTVCSYDANRNCIVENTIPMGAQVSALDYYEAAHIIFFGLKTGEIGFINYKKDRRNQPIYRNQMDSKVSTIKFFEKDAASDPSCYLLATSSRGTVVMFELGSSPTYLSGFLEENKKLTGIELPEENFGEIRTAQYLKDKHLVKLITARGIFLWNPFAEDLLKQLTADLSKENDSILNSTIKNTILY